MIGGVLTLVRGWNWLVARVPTQPILQPLLAFPSEQLIAFARLVLAGFALVSPWYGAPAFATAPSAVGVLVIYILFAAGIAIVVMTVQPLRRWIGFSIHAVDIGIAVVLTHLTEGAAGPFFTFFTFALLTGTLRWDGWGALATALILLLGYVIVALVEGVLASGSDLTHVITQSIYLIIVGIMFAYVGGYQAFSRARIALLAAWPPGLASAADALNLNPSLEHAARVMQAKRILVIWEDSVEPVEWLLDWSREHSDLIPKPPGTLSALVLPPMDERSFIMWDVSGTLLPFARPRRPPVNLEFVQELKIGSAVSAPMRTDNFNGRIFVVNPNVMSDEVVLLARIIGSRIGIELEHQRLQAQIAVTEAANERIRLGRDLHDGAAQVLTSLRSQLRELGETNSPQVNEKLTQLNASLSELQREMREFLDSAMHAPQQEAVQVPLKNWLRPILAAAADQWSLDTDLSVVPNELTVSKSLSSQIAHIVTEAASNAARHGKANRLRIAVTRSAHALELQIQDDGTGIPEMRVTYGGDGASGPTTGPRSIRARVAELGANISLSDAGPGLELRITIPTRGSTL